MIEISANKRNCILEESMNIHPGKAYRVIVAGINPLCALNLDGILESVMVEKILDNYEIKEIRLCDGIMYDSDSSPRNGSRFVDEMVCVAREKNIHFGMILDEEGFLRVREKISSKYSN